MTDAKPNALDMLKLDQDAFMLEVSRVVSPKPWKHTGAIIDDDGVVHCSQCGCMIPPQLEQSAEWWAFKLSRQCPPGELCNAIWCFVNSTIAYENGSLYWYIIEATPLEQIAVALVALRKWRMP